MSSCALLKKIASEVLGEEVASRLWGRIEIAGDIAIIRKPFDVEVEPLKAVAEELLRRLPYLKSVWATISPVYGVERLRDYIHLAGEKRSETIYKEYGCKFFLDITKVYFSPVLGYDHMRVAKQVRKGEKVFNMFAGYGPYSVIISKFASPSYVLSADVNPAAARYAKINVEINKVGSINEVVETDSLLLSSGLEDKFERVLMPLPDLFDGAFSLALSTVVEGGVVHPHLIVEAPTKKAALVVAKRVIEEKARELEAELEVAGGHVIRGVGPRRYHVTLDVTVKRKPLRPM